ncbi:hypothetical protein QIG73_26835, partial [Klebsiella pneumoniae]|nr:hypothetical protein [Klebsiella pneumoniae]
RPLNKTKGCLIANFATVPYFLMPVRAWKASAPDLTGHRPQIAGNRNADRIARPSPLPVYSHVSDPPFANQLITHSQIT